MQVLKNEIHIPKRKEKSFLPISTISTQAQKADLRKCFEMFTGTVISSKTTKPVIYQLAQCNIPGLKLSSTTVYSFINTMQGWLLNSDPHRNLRIFNKC